MVPENQKKRLLAGREIAREKRARRGVASRPLADDAPLPVQAREIPTADEPRAHTTCKRCAAEVAADADECWNCGLRFPHS